MPVADILTKESIAEAEVILNRTNIALARSRKLIQSWMSAPPSEITAPVDDNEDDFVAENETAGLGSTKNPEDTESSLTSSLRRNRANDEKLLEQILGKKGAKEHLRAKKAKQDLERMSSTVKQQAAKKQDPAPASDDEEEGRAAMISQKQRRSGPQQSHDNTRVSAAEEPGEHDSKSVSSKGITKSSKRKPSSYLDELLMQKSSKKKSRLQVKDMSND